MRADRFSLYCWRRFLRFLACPLTLPPVPASCCLSSLLQAIGRCCLAAAVARERGGDTELTWAMLRAQIATTWLSLRWGANWIQTAAAAACGAGARHGHVAPLWVLVILVIAHWMRCSITYEIRISRRFSRDWPIDRSPSLQSTILRSKGRPSSKMVIQGVPEKNCTKFAM